MSSSKPILSIIFCKIDTESNSNMHQESLIYFAIEMFDTQIQGVCGVRKLISYISIIVSGTRYSEVCMMNRVSSASLGFIIFARDKKDILRTA